MIGTPGALTQLVLIKLALASLVAAGFAGCVPCNNDVTEHGLAARPKYDGAIDACITQGRCIPLCRSAFGFDASIEIDSCKIDYVDAANAHLIVRWYDPNACVADDSGDDDFFYSDDDGGYTDDGDYGTDDSSDDGSTDDGSSDDGGTDDGDYGGDDDGGDSGDDGGDWGDRHAPHYTIVKTVTSSSAAQ